MTYHAGAAAYKNMEVTSSNRLKIIIMVYDAAIASLKEAVETHQRHDYLKRNQYISRAQSIIFELNNALDMKNGGDIADNLRKLYHFLNRHLGDALTSDSLAAIEQSVHILETLREAWQAIAESRNAGLNADTTGAVYHGRPPQAAAGGST